MTEIASATEDAVQPAESAADAGDAGVAGALPAAPAGGRDGGGTAGHHRLRTAGHLRP